MSNTHWSFNSPPGWPEAPRGWVPPDGWHPDPSWPPAPEGWDFWVPESDLPVASVGQMPHESVPSSGSTTPEKSSRSWWATRPAIGIAALLVGIGIGAAGGDDTDAARDEAQKDARASIAKIQDETDELVDEAEAAALQDQEEVVDEAVAAAIDEEKARRSKLIDRAVKAAVKKTKANLKTTEASKPKTLVSSTDPRFDTCGAANAAGYGNYRRGSDVEYGWYQDRDNDGFVCE